MQMCHTSFSLIFQIKTNLILCFFTILHKFSKCCFPILFLALNSSTHFNTPKLRLAAKNIPFFAKDVDAAVFLKTTLFYAFCARGCVASHVESEPSGNRTYGFREITVERFFVFYCFCQYIDKVNEENWQNVLININFCQFFTNILWINLHTTFILQNFGLKLCQCVPMA